MNKHQKTIELICNNFNMKIEDLDSTLKTNIYGNFVGKINILFIKSKTSIISAQISEGRFIFEIFKDNYKIGINQTWEYIYKGLFFMGLIKDRKYADHKIQDGITIDELVEFNTLEEYLKSEESYSKIMSNFNSDPKWFQKIVASTICAFSLKNSFAEELFSLETIKSFKQKKYISKYNGFFECLTIISNHQTNTSLTKDEIKKLNDFSDKIKNQNKKEIQERLAGKSDEARKISSLRSQFSNSIDLEFKSFLKTQEKDMQHVISDYAKTFDLNIEMTATDKAHIIPVWYLVKEKRWDDIKNPNNGLILDPNTHRLFDKDKTTTLKDNRIFNDYHEFVIDKRFINPERRKFMDEWIENKGRFE